MQICANCGKDVSFGSGNFVNRVPILDDYSTRKNIYQYPCGDWICAECDNVEERGHREE